MVEHIVVGAVDDFLARELLLSSRSFWLILLRRLSVGLRSSWHVCTDLAVVAKAARSYTVDARLLIAP